MASEQRGKRFRFGNFGVQTFRFGRILESKPSDLGVFWSPTLQLWFFFESNTLALE